MGDQDHDICSKPGNTNVDDGTDNEKNAGWYCAGFLGDTGVNENAVCRGSNYTSPTACIDTFRNLWKDQVAWLKRGLQDSTADWQIIVTHFPAYYPNIAKDLRKMSSRYGVDLIVSGHTHAQEIWYHKKAYGQNWHDTAILVSGGGGGIFSEGTPIRNGDD